MTASILIKSWRKDRFFLDYLLRSIAKFCTGFRDIVVVLPEEDRPHFEFTNFYTASVKWITEPEGDKYLHQQVVKMNADQYCAGDIIFVIDSDCFIMGPMTPEMFLSNGKPISLIRHWQDAGTAIAWKPIVEKFLTWEPAFEGMCCLPFVVDRRVLPLIRDYCAATHRKSLTEYVMSQEQGKFSEFNALSNFSQRFVPHFYDWRIANPAEDGFPRILKQQWSWDERGVQPFVEEYEAILKE